MLGAKKVQELGQRRVGSQLVSRLPQAGFELIQIFEVPCAHPITPFHLLFVRRTLNVMPRDSSGSLVFLHRDRDLRIHASL